VSKTYPVKVERIRDMKRILMFVTIGFLLIVALIGAGGKIYMDKREEQKEAEKIEAERMSVEALKNTFEDIKSVEFINTDYHAMTGSYFMLVEVKNIEDDIAKFDYSYELDQSSTNKNEKITSYGVVDEDGVQKKGTTSSTVQVVYSNGKEDEI